MTLRTKAWTPAELLEAVDHWDAFRSEWWQEQVRLLLRQIEDRDKTIAEQAAEIKRRRIAMSELRDEVYHKKVSIAVMGQRIDSQAEELQELRQTIEVLRRNMRQALGGYMAQCPECDGLLPEHEAGCELEKAMGRRSN
ncbi:MAG: hypothetical protein K6T83_14335 [Alicyclobacillus sp.]|nr:hypothetical protein [Alicyclobacillus sp.]